MSEFGRRINCEPLRAMALQAGPNWWKDLLAAWSPSGSSRPDGLRLALRNNYLNFYSAGQSVGRVGIGADNRPYVETHIKYAVDPAPDEQKYLRFDAQGHAGGAYAKVEPSIGLWTSRSAGFAGAEKRFVDRVVSANAHVIDLEMGIPADKGAVQRAPRVDLVALEPTSEGLQIVFWEAKRIQDARLASHTIPEVIPQMREYRDFLMSHRQQVIAAYVSACEHLVLLRDMAFATTGSPIELSPLVTGVASRALPVDLDEQPRLVIYDDGQATATRHRHIARLVQGEDDDAVPTLVFNDQQDFILRRPESMG